MYIIVENWGPCIARHKEVTSFMEIWDKKKK